MRKINNGFTISEILAIWTTVEESIIARNDSKDFQLDSLECRCVLKNFDFFNQCKSLTENRLKYRKSESKDE